MYNIKDLGTVDYEDSFTAMKHFTEQRNNQTLDEYWLLEHQPVFTLGLAAKREHILQKIVNIPIMQSDRGGQVTYHGPGQIVIYTLLDLKRTPLSIRDLVIRLETGVIDFLATQNITAHGNRTAPGVYVDDKKIASIGLKVRKHCTYHGISFNAKMDLTPFKYINVCGYANLQVTQLNDYTPVTDLQQIKHQLLNNLLDIIYA